MPPEATDSPTPADPPLWRGLDEYLDSPAFAAQMADEFPEDAAEWTDPVSRRNFLTIMGASVALAAAGCSPRPASRRKIVPYTIQPDELIPGVPLVFASACPVGGYGTGVIVRSNEGRPTKIEGNPDHPSSKGGTGPIEQASILDLYDPDRSQEPTFRTQPALYENAVKAVRAKLFNTAGQPNKAVRVRILTGAVTSPTLGAQLTALLNDFPEARWCQWEPCGQDNVRLGTQRAFGRELNVVYDFAAADVVLSLDADFLGSGPGHARYCRDFASRRKVRQVAPANPLDGVTADRMNRLYVAECMPSVTGSSADHRLPLRGSQIEAFARAVAAKLGVAGVTAPTGLPDSASKWLDPLVKDLRSRNGACVVVAGEHQPPAVHALAHAMNAALGAGGKTVFLTAPVEARPAGKVIDLKTLVADMDGGRVDALLILGGTNPAYTAPSDVKFAEATAKVGLRLHLGTHRDETAALCDWHVNEAHHLETWGDVRGHDGTATVMQPLIAPLYAGRSASEFVADVVRSTAREGLDLVRSHWLKRFQDAKTDGEFELYWQEAVRQGVIPGTAAAREEKVALAANWAEGASPAPAAPAAGTYEINFRADSNLYDGRYANNGWLQELPKPVTKLTWDNAAFVSLKTAQALGIDKDFRWTAGERGRTEVTVLELDLNGRKVKAPAWYLPGHPDDAITVHLGFGRTKAGRVGNPDKGSVFLPSNENPNAAGDMVRGFNAYALQTSAAPAFAAGLKATKTKETYFLACYQANWAMTQKDPLNGKILDRAPVRRGDLTTYRLNPAFAKITPTAAAETGPISHNIPGPEGATTKKESGAQYGFGNSYGQDHHGKDDHHDHGKDGKADDHGHDHGGGHAHDPRVVPLTMYHPNDNLYPDAPRVYRRWGMAIDLSACTGCNACVVACQSENNTPVVGKTEVTRGHDMYWLRIDRYYEGTPNEPDATRTYFQPVPCMQCEKAPCEVVCPVAATVHSADGLNDMVYNRCVGTRYCSNNCPYKVRRFNFLTFQDWFTSSLKLGRNPDVSVRSRGVMEKCTYCVQRLRYAEIVAEREHRPIKDGEARTACQSACPAGAIAFGDIGDKGSEVAKWKAEPTNYGLLAELNTMPRTTYLASLRNPNPELR